MAAGPATKIGNARKVFPALLESILNPTAAKEGVNDSLDVSSDRLLELDIKKENTLDSKIETEGDDAPTQELKPKFSMSRIKKKYTQFSKEDKQKYNNKLIQEMVTQHEPHFIGREEKFVTGFS